jgi:hypothetical protein
VGWNQSWRLNTKYGAENEKDKKKTRQQQAVAWAICDQNTTDQGRCYRCSDWLNRLGVCNLEEETTKRHGRKIADRKLRDRNESEGVEVDVNQQ